MIKNLFNSSRSFTVWRIMLVFYICFMSSVNYVDAKEPQNSSINISKPDSMVVEFYPIPSPDEILQYIDRNSLHYRDALLNNPGNVEIYNTSYDKKIGFGIYMADLAYALSFEQTGTVMNYFSITEKMGRDLNLFPPDVEEISDRFIDNVNQYDSLKSLYTESYIMMIDHLNETSNINSYAIISAGSFIESIYFALNSVKSEYEDDAYRLRIWNQKLVFEQLMKITERHLDKLQKEKLFADLAGVSRVFDSYTIRPKPIKSEVKGNNTIVLGQNISDENKPASIQELKNEINLLRRKWVKR